MKMSVAPPAYGVVGDGIVLNAEGGFPPCVVRSAFLHPGIHAIELSRSDPGLRRLEAGGGPPPVKHRKDEEYPVGEGIFRAVGIFGKESSFGIA